MSARTSNREILQILIALIILFEGFNIAFLSHELIKTSPWMRVIGLVMLFCGIGFFIYHYKRKELEAAEAERTKKLESRKISKFKHPRRQEPGLEEVEESIVTRIMKKIDMHVQKIFPYMFPIIGALIIDAVVIYNYYKGTVIDLGSFDLVTILFGVTLVAYNFVPKQFATARDFTVFFFGIMFLIWIFPQIIGNLLGEQANAEYTSILLAQPTGGILSMLGISNNVSGDLLTFELSNGEWTGVGIGQACSGLYTATIFIAVFVTFILVEYKKLDKKVVLLLALGIALVYFANILRMVTLVLVWHHYGQSAFNWTHANLGTMIFILWLSPFMYVMYRFLMREDFVQEPEVEDGEVPQAEKKAGGKKSRIMH